MDKNEYQNFLKRQKKGKQPPLVCVGCGRDLSSGFENHHIIGRNNSDWTEPLCKHCHYEITLEQNRLSPKARSTGASLQNKRAFSLISIGALLRRIGQHLINLGIEMVENV